MSAPKSEAAGEQYAVTARVIVRASNAVAAEVEVRTLLSDTAAESSDGAIVGGIIESVEVAGALDLSASRGWS